MAYAIEFEESVIKNDIPGIPMPYREQIKKAIRERLTQEPVKLAIEKKFITIKPSLTLTYSMAVCLFTHEAFVCPAEGEPLPYRGLLGFMANPFSAIDYGLQQAKSGGDNNSQ